MKRRGEAERRAGNESAIQLGRDLALELILKVLGVDDKAARIITVEAIQKVQELAAMQAILCDDEELNEVVKESFRQTYNATFKPSRVIMN